MNLVEVLVRRVKSSSFYCSLGATKRIRCGVCDNCLSNDCGKCKYCLDKPKFGGAGRLRQSCVRKKYQNMQGNSQKQKVYFVLM